VELKNFYPECAHELVKPQQRYPSGQSAVDWHCFWLRGEEDRDRSNAAQYTRWRELWKLQEARATANSDWVVVGLAATSMDEPMRAQNRPKSFCSCCQTCRRIRLGACRSKSEKRSGRT